MPLVDNVCKGKTFFAIMQIYFTLQVTEPPILGRFAVVFSVFGYRLQGYSYLCFAE
jgi:hypothetical protein